jgi:tetratricopeptide (TPR) repeat protein/predicted Ser/Thr protein kinase
MIGRTVSHYKILARLGGGGMGVVYKAHDEKLDRAVALKFLPHHVGHTDAQRKRFLREARATSALDHPNICTIYDIDETNDGQTFIAMGFCEGEPLDKVIERGGLPIEKAVDIAKQVAGGLASAHAKGIVHRDIKPANIIVTGEGGVRIIDFGIAKLSGQTAVTREGTTVGTVVYMSPEQAQGGDVDHRTDIWALGAVLYEMVTGKPPFAADHQAAVLYKILNDDPASVVSLRGETPGRLAEIIRRALHKDSAGRFASMEEMTVALEKACSDSTAAPTGNALSTLTCARAALERHDWSEAFAAFCDADTRTELGAEDLERWAAAAVWVNRLDVYIDASERAHSLYVNADRLADAGGAAIEVAEGHYGMGSRSVCNGWLRRAEKLLERVPDAVENGYLARLKARIAIEEDKDLEAALDHTAKALLVAEEHCDADLRALAIQDHGRVLVLQNRVREGMELLDEAMATAISGELSPITVGATYCNMISMCDKIADYRRAGEWSDQADRWCKPHSESAFPGICSVHRAEVMRVRGDWVGAESEAEQARKRTDGAVTRVAAEAYYVKGEIKLRRGEHREAEAFFQEANRRGRHPVPGLALLRLAQGRQGAARSLIDRALCSAALDLDRIRLLPVGVDIAIATGDIVTARSRADELSSLAARFESAVFSGQAGYAAGAVALSEGNVEAALQSLSSARALLQGAKLPYEEACARLLTAVAYWREDEDDLAELEALAARASFEELGAVSDIERIDALIGKNSRG